MNLSALFSLRSWISRLCRRSRQPIRKAHRQRPSFRPRLELLEQREVPAVSITEFGISTASSGALDIARGPDGNQWFVEELAHKIAKITPTGVITEYAVAGDAVDVWAGIGTSVWFTELSANKVGRIDTSTGVITEYTPPTANAGPNGITLGADGNMWFAEYNVGKIGRITPDGQITEFTVGGRPTDLALGSDGNVWFTSYNTNQIGKISTSGTATYIAAPSGSGPAGIAAGADGNLYVTLYNTGKVAQVTTAGSITQFSIPTANSHPWAINASADGTLWLAESGGNKIAQMTTSGQFTEHALPTAGSDPRGIVVSATGAVWWTEYGGNKIGTFGAVPTVGNPGPQASAERDHIELQLLGSDPEGEPLTFSATGLLDGLVIDPNTGLISGTLSCDAYDLTGGQSLVTITVTDSQGNFSSQSFVWTVADVAVKNVYWTGAGDGVHWNDIYNWDILDLPEHCDEVFINDAGITVLHEAGDVSIHSLHSLAALDFNGGLELATASSVSNAFAFDGTLVMQSGPLDLTGGGDLAGTIIVQAGAEINFLAGTFALNDGLVFDGAGEGNVGGGAAGQEGSLDAKEGEVKSHAKWTLKEGGKFSGEGTLTFTEELNWTGGSMTGTGKTLIAANGGQLKISGNAEKTLDGRTIENKGGITWEGAGNIKIGANFSRIINRPDALFEIKADVSFIRSAQVVVEITNNGIFRKSAGAGVSRIEGEFVNNAGRLELDSGTVLVESLNLQSGTVTGPGTLIIAKSANWAGGTMDGAGTTELAAGATLVIIPLNSLMPTLSRTLIAFGDIQLQGALELTGSLTSYGKFTVVGDCSVGSLVAPGTWENRGSFIVAGSTTTVTAEFNNRSAVTVDAGTLILRGNGLHTGTFTASGTATVVFDTGTPGGIGTNVFDPELDDTDPFMLRGDGLYVVAGGARLEVAESAVVEAANVQLADGGIFSGEGTLRILTSLAWSAGIMVDAGVTEIARDAVLDIGGIEASPLGIEKRTLLNYGTINWLGQADITLNDNASLLNDGIFGGGTFTIQNSRKIRSDEEDPLSSKFVMQNGAQFIKAFDQQTIIEVPVVDGGAQYQIFPFDVVFAKGYKKIGGTTHVAGNALTIIGDYEQLAGNMLIEGGSISISGTAILKGGQVVRGGGTFSATGGIQFMGGQLID